MTHQHDRAICRFCCDQSVPKKVGRITYSDPVRQWNIDRVHPKRRRDQVFFAGPDI